MTHIYAIILAGGSGSRMKQNTPKQYLELNNKTILQHTLETFNSHKEIDRIIITCSPEYYNFVTDISNSIENNKLYKIATAGKTRQLSSFNALTCTSFNTLDVILFHDAARPFVSHEIITNTINAVKRYGSASVYVPAVDTITIVEDNMVKDIPNRESLYNTQTPQGFTFETIYEAHLLAKKNNFETASDDVSLVIKNNKNVYAVLGEYINIKITNPSDLIIAEKILLEKNKDK